MQGPNDEEALNIIRSMLQNEGVVIDRLIKRNNTRAIFIVSGCPKSPNGKAFIKIYIKFKNNMIINEYNNLNIFYNCTKGKPITAPEPLAFDPEKGAIAYEFLEGSSLRRILFRSNNYKTDLEDGLRLAAEALSEFHKIFKIKDDGSIDLGDHPQIEKSFQACALNRIVRPFLDFAPHNIMISCKNQERKAFLIDFPQYNFDDKGISSLPHADLAYFLWHMIRIGRYPQFSVLKKYGWNDKKIIKIFLNTYFERCSIELKKEDIDIVNYFFNNYALNWSKVPWGFKSETKDRLRSLCLKYYSHILIDSISRSF